MLSDQVQIIERIYKKVQTKIEKEKNVCCNCSAKQFTAYSVSAIETIFLVSGLICFCIKFASSQEKTSNIALSIGYGCYALAALLSKIKDVMYRRWGLNEKLQKKLYALQGKASLISSTHSTIELINHFQEERQNVQEEKQNVQEEKEKMKRLSKEIVAQRKLTNPTMLKKRYNKSHLYHVLKICLVMLEELLVLQRYGLKVRCYYPI